MLIHVRRDDLDLNRHVNNTRIVIINAKTVFQIVSGLDITASRGQRRFIFRRSYST